MYLVFKTENCLFAHYNTEILLCMYFYAPPTPKDGLLMHVIPILQSNARSETEVLSYFEDRPVGIKFPRYSFVSGILIITENVNITTLAAPQ